MQKGFIDATLQEVTGSSAEYSGRWADDATALKHVHADGDLYYSTTERDLREVFNYVPSQGNTHDVYHFKRVMTSNDFQELQRSLSGNLLPQAQEGQFAVKGAGGWDVRIYTADDEIVALKALGVQRDNKLGDIDVINQVEYRNALAEEAQIAAIAIGTTAGQALSQGNPFDPSSIPGGTVWGTNVTSEANFVILLRLQPEIPAHDIEICLLYTSPSPRDS